jgi:hypothetical protein
MMAAQMPRHGTAGKHGEMLKLAKKFFAEQQAFLDQVGCLSGAAWQPPWNR